MERKIVLAIFAPALVIGNENSTFCIGTLFCMRL